MSLMMSKNIRQSNQNQNHWTSIQLVVVPNPSSPMVKTTHPFMKKVLMGNLMFNLVQ
ncbi:unnamed protein product [Brassica rapa subsp. trilocularis]